MTVPLLLVLHCAAVMLAVHSTSSRIKEYISPADDPARCKRSLLHRPMLYMLQRSLGMMMVLALLGVCLLVVNASLDGLYRCTDPVIKTSIVSVEVDIVYQWLFVILSIAVMSAVALTVEILYRDDPRHHAMHVFQCICALLRNPEIEAAKQALHWWKSKALGCIEPTPDGSETPIRIEPWRRMLFFVLHLPVLTLASTPSIGYVLAQNVPAGASLAVSSGS